MEQKNLIGQDFLYFKMYAYSDGSSEISEKIFCGRNGEKEGQGNCHNRSDAISLSVKTMRLEKLYGMKILRFCSRKGTGC